MGISPVLPGLTLVSSCKEIVPTILVIDTPQKESGQSILTQLLHLNSSSRFWRVILVKSILDAAKKAGVPKTILDLDEFDEFLKQNSTFISGQV